MKSLLKIEEKLRVTVRRKMRELSLRFVNVERENISQIDQKQVCSN